MNALLAFLAVALPELIKYFTKTPVNAVTAGAGGSAVTLLLVGLMQTGTYDQMLTFLQNYGEAGIIASALMAGLRTVMLVYTAAKPDKK